MAITRSGRGRPVPVDNQSSPATTGRGRKRHRSPSLPSNPTPNQHLQEEEQQQQQLVRNQSVSEEQQESIVEEEEESVESLIEGLQKESLVAMVMEAISNDPHLIERVRNLADVDPAQREIFVSQLGRQDMAPLTSEALNSFYGRYGEIENCTINVQQICGKTDGRAFITFKQRKAAWEAAKQTCHKIGDIYVMCTMPSLSRFPNASRWLQPKYTPRFGCVLRYKYKLPENQYVTTSSTTEEEEEPLEKLLEGLGTYNLFSLLKEGLMKTPTILESIYKHADIDPTLRHIAAFRIGPYFMTNRTIVNSVFEKYGEIERCMFDEDGARVLFKHRTSAWKVLKQPYLKIGDYLTMCTRPSGSRAMLFWTDC